MTVTELINKLQDIAHQGQALLEVKDIDKVIVTSEGVRLVKNILTEADIEDLAGLCRC